MVLHTVSKTIKFDRTKKKPESSDQIKFIRINLKCYTLNDAR